MATSPVTTGPTWDRLEDQIAWYDRKSGDAQRWYKRIKVLQLATAAHYATTANPTTLLAEQIEGLVSQEHAKWTSSHEEPAGGAPAPTKT